MPFLGAVEFGAEVRIAAIFVTPPGDFVTAASVRLVHEDGTVIGPLAATFEDPEWVVELIPSKGGRWRVYWMTEPIGGATDDWIYVDA
jgi:hypothetical protein